jgi:hypothetical protein
VNKAVVYCCCTVSRLGVSRHVKGETAFEGFILINGRELGAAHVTEDMEAYPLLCLTALHVMES